MNKNGIIMFNSKEDKVFLELAVLRYRAVVGTASMNKNTLIDGVKSALISALQSYKKHLEKVSILLEKDTDSVYYVGSNHFICGWPMLTFDITLIRKKLLVNNVITVRVYVAADMLRNSQVKTDTIQYCKDHNIIVVDNLFKFCQPDSLEVSNGATPSAELEILDQIERHLKQRCSSAPAAAANNRRNINRSNNSTPVKTTNNSPRSSSRKRSSTSHNNANKSCVKTCNGQVG